MKKAIQFQAFVNRERYAVPQSVLDSLPGGVYTPYVVAQEGISTPYSLDAGRQTVLKWSRSIIQRIAEKFRGIKFFRGHGKGTNSHSGRETVGRAETVYTDIIDNKLSIVALLKGEHPEDVCSMEAAVIYNSAGEVENVEQISAVALGDSRIETPAFRGATALEQVQCFKEIKQMYNRENLVNIQCFEAPDNGGDGGAFARQKMAFHELRAEVMAAHVFPRELYSVEQIIDDRELFPKIKERVLADAVSKDEFDAMKEKADGYLTELTKYKDSERTEKAVSVIDKAIGKRKYSPTQKKYFEIWKEEGFFNDIDPSNESSVREALEKAEQRYINYRDKGAVEDEDAVEHVDDTMSEDVAEIADNIPV